MQTDEKVLISEFDNLLKTSLLKPPADFMEKVMRQVETTPSALAATRALASQQVKAKRQIKVVVLTMTKLAAFVFGIMLATAAV